MKKRELLYAAVWGAAVMALTTVPLLIMWWYTPLQAVFPGVLFNSDDHGVYFSWMRQAHDGHLLFRNLFTTEPQRGIYFQPFFLLLGWLSRLPGLDIPTTYHLARLALGVLVLVLVYRLGAFFTADLFTRRCIFWVTALGAGLGWNPWPLQIGHLTLGWVDHVLTYEPVDVWQPEALTFPSLYAFSLFAAALALMLGVVISLLLAEERGPRWAVGAGLCGLALGFVHSYDVIHLTLACGAYLVSRWVVERRFPGRSFGLSCLAAAIAAPSVGYMAWLYLTEPVFKARADTATLSHNPILYALGYGLLIPLALWGGLHLRSGSVDGGTVRETAGKPGRSFAVALAAFAVLLAAATAAYEAAPALRILVPLLTLTGWAFALLAFRRILTPSPRHPLTPSPPHPLTPSPPHRLLPIAWAFAGMVAAYLPFAFQRKMVMGEHFPLALLAGIGLAEVSRRLAAGLSRPKLATALAALGIAVLSISTVRWLVRDVAVARNEGVTSSGTHPVYWPESEIHAFEWLGAHASPQAALLTHPFAGVFAPAFSGRPVYAGHWAETPDWNRKLPQVFEFYWGIRSSRERYEFLRTNGITHVLWGPMDQSYVNGLAGRRALPPARPLSAERFLAPVFTEGEAVLYEFRPEAQ